MVSHSTSWSLAPRDRSIDVYQPYVPNKWPKRVDVVWAVHSYHGRSYDMNCPRTPNITPQQY